MVVVSYSGKEINGKLVYYGAGLSGKTTNLESIYEAVPDSSRGKMVSMKTQSDRTLFFDLLPLDLGEIMGFKTRFLLYTVPGQVFYNATRKLVLKGADAIVFVADSEVGKMEENRESIANLRANLAEYGLNLDAIPWVIQYNKRDLPNVYTLEELNAELNPGGKVPFFEAVATQGKGVFETFRGISHLLMEKVTRDLRRTPAGGHRPVEESAVTTASIKAEAPRAAVTPTTPPARAIAREAQETAAPLQSAPIGELDYGREIQLPGAMAAVVAPSTPVLAPEPVAVAAPSPTASRAVAEQATAPPAAVAQRGGEWKATPIPQASTPAAPAPSAPSPAPAVPTMTMPAPKAEPVSREVRTQVGANGDAPEAQASVLEVPVRIPRSGTREIVLRIVLTDGE